MYIYIYAIMRRDVVKHGYITLREILSFSTVVSGGIVNNKISSDAHSRRGKLRILESYHGNNTRRFNVPQISPRDILYETLSTRRRS